MSKLLFRMFIKDYKNTQNSAVRVRYGVFAGAVGIVLNTVLCALKLFAGILCSSVSIVADALNNLSDAASSVITLIGFKMSGKPADKEHPFGHGRIEYICGFLVSVAILIMGFELLINSAKKIISAEAVNNENMLITCIILIAAIFTKLWMFFFDRCTARQINSSSMMATAQDSLSDVASTSVVLIGTIVGFLTNFAIDGYLGALVSIFILYTGFNTIKDSLTPLLGEAPDPDLAKKIEEIVLSYDDVLGIHDLIIHNYGPGHFMLSLHAEVSADEDIIKTHDTIDLIENRLKNEFNCNATIHMDPIETNNSLINEVKQFVGRCIFNISKDLTFHDFRMVCGPTHTNLIFDVVVPFGFYLTDDEIVQKITDEVKKYNPAYNCVINIDKKFV